MNHQMVPKAKDIRNIMALYQNSFFMSSNLSVAVLPPQVLG